MTVTLSELAMYAVALAILVLTPGPVVVATIARTLVSGWRTAMPLAAGVSICDMVWPLLAIFGLSAIVQVYGEVLVILRYVGAAILIWMGWRLIVGSREALAADPDPALMRKTAWEGFAAGFLVNVSNPKAILFFVAILPTLFDLTALTTLDIAVILFMSALIPFLGNVFWAMVAHAARRFLRSARAVRRVNQVSGGALCGAGVAIATT